MFAPRQISLETERLGPRRVDGLRKEDEEWQRKAHAAVLSIQDLTVKFFETTTRAQKGKHTSHFLSALQQLCLWPLNLCVACLLHNKVHLTLQQTPSQPLTHQSPFNFYSILILKISLNCHETCQQIYVQAVVHTFHFSCCSVHSIFNKSVFLYFILMLL